MEATVRLRLSEISEGNLSGIREIFTKASGQKDPELIISFDKNVKKREYFARLEESNRQADEGKFVAFTMKELEEYVKSIAL